ILSGGTIGTVDEDDLPNGNDPAPKDSLSTDGSFGVNFGADGPGDVTNITGPAGLTSRGVALVYTFDNAANPLTATKRPGGATICTVSLDPNTGQYHFTLAGPLDHSTAGEDLKPLNFGFTATDFDGDPVNGNFTVNVRDDVPIANNNIVNTSDNQTINIVIVFDKSGSMDEDPGMDGYSSRIDLARAAVAALLATYDSFADINVKIVDFPNNADD